MSPEREYDVAITLHVVVPAYSQDDALRLVQTMLPPEIRERASYSDVLVEPHEPRGMGADPGTP